LAFLASLLFNNLRVINRPDGFDSHPRLHQIPNVYAGFSRPLAPSAVYLPRFLPSEVLTK
jgi:hypothetical protein